MKPSDGWATIPQSVFRSALCCPYSRTEYRILSVFRLPCPASASGHSASPSVFGLHFRPTRNHTELER